MLTYRIRTLVWLAILGSSSPSWAQPAPGPAPEPEQPAAGDPGDVAEAPAAEGEAEAPAAEGEAASAEATAETEAAPEKPTGGEGDIIVIGQTGTRTKSSFGGSAGAIEIVDAKQLAKTGATNLADVVKDLSASQGSGPQGSFGIGAAGGAAASLNLRGLGPTATLILLNGRRLTPSAALIGLTDLAAIPLSAVERIEVLKAGAAAIYGADAVGGVVNIITRRNLDGARIELDGQTTSRLDQDEYTLSGSVGAVGKHSRVLAAVSYFRRSQLLAGQRPMPADKYVIPTKSSHFGTFTPTTMGAMAMADSACPNPSMVPTIPTAPPGMMGGGTSCPYSIRDQITYFPNVERVTAFASGQYDISDHTGAFAELVVSRYRGDNLAPHFTFAAPNPIVPANHIDNPYGVPVFYEGRTQDGPQRAPAAEDMLRGVVGLNGDFGGIAAGSPFEAWNWELSASMGASRFRQTNEDNIRPAFQAALDACSNPADLSKCFNPFHSAEDGTGTPNSRAVIDSFTGRQTILTDEALQTYNGGLSGPLFALPGGDLQAALGAEIRHESRSTEFDHDAMQQRYGYLIGSANFAAQRSVYSGYLELRWPFLKGVELQTAARLERYTDTQTTPSPFAGLSMSVGDMIGRSRAPSALQNLSLRANVSRAFRAPLISDTAPGFSTSPALLKPSTRDAAGVYVPVQTTGNPNLKPETAITTSAGFSWKPSTLLSLTADYWYYNYTNRIQTQNATVILQNRDLDPMGPASGAVDLDGSGNVTKVRVTPYNVAAAVTTSGVDFGLAFQLDGSQFGGSRDDFGQFSLGATGTYTMSYTLPRNEVPRRLGDLPFSGCDQQYPAATAVGAPQPDPNSRCDVAGHRNPPAGPFSVPALPRLKANLPVSWTVGNHSLVAIVHYISGFDDDSGSLAELAANGGSWIPAVVTLDLTYGFSLKDVLGKQLGLRVGVLNVFDRLPPTVFGAFTPYEGEVHDPRGRMLYAKIDGDF